MDAVSNAISKVTTWEFLNEPMYRWFVFLIALSLMLFVWHTVLSYMH